MYYHANSSADPICINQTVDSASSIQLIGGGSINPYLAASIFAAYGIYWLSSQAGSDFGWFDNGNPDFGNPQYDNRGNDPIQSSGRTFKQSTANKINEYQGTNYSRHQLGKALEVLKGEYGVAPSEHGIITRSGSFYNKAGQYIGNILDYIP